MCPASDVGATEMCVLNVERRDLYGTSTREQRPEIPMESELIGMSPAPSEVSYI
ncbi:hypothetical protein HanIR_Chr08g0342881 [Helianthus annuus]|nr:hypothetical protein HanIR_Chr08g0342881 [Helianthus annuus]